MRNPTRSRSGKLLVFYEQGGGGSGKQRLRPCNSASGPWALPSHAFALISGFSSLWRVLPDSSTDQLEADLSKSGMASRSAEFPKLPSASRAKHITQKTSVCFLMLQPRDKCCCLADCPSRCWVQELVQQTGEGRPLWICLCSAGQCKGSWAGAKQTSLRSSIPYWPQHGSQANRIMVFSYSELGTLWHHGVLNI